VTRTAVSFAGVVVFTLLIRKILVLKLAKAELLRAAIAAFPQDAAAL